MHKADHPVDGRDRDMVMHSYDSLHRYTKYKTLVLGPTVLYSDKYPINCGSHPSSTSTSQFVLETEITGR